MEASSDPYEQKLFQMFQSCDSESSGLLNEKALRCLCEMLELRDNGSELIDDLAARGHTKSYVSFAVFKEALLNFLGTELDGTTTNSPSLTQKALITSTQGERVLIITDGPDTNIDSPPESSEREVSPKLVVGSKKYGRRSRPHMLIDDVTPSDSESETVISSNGCNTLVQRSSSQTDIAAYRRRRPTLSGNKLKRCASLPAQNQQRVREQSVGIIKTPTTQVASMKDSSVLSKPIYNSSVESLAFDFTNLTNTIHAIWQAFGSEVGTNYLSCKQLQTVCERIGLQRVVAERVAVECFEKLCSSSRCNLLNQFITFSEFMKLLHANRHDDGVQKLSDVNYIREFQTAVATANGDNEINVRTCKFAVCNTSGQNSKNYSDTVKDIPALMETLPAHSVIAIWERVGISNGIGLLLTLGFDEREINLSQLSKVIEEELRNLEGEPQTTLLKASLALQSAELTALRQTFRQLSDENKKLHDDNKDANRRVALLAQEIDEMHASLEDTTKKEIRLLEQRHAEVVRDLTLRMANDRENWTNLTASLEGKLKTFEHNEIKLQTDLELIRNENSALEEDQKSLQKQVTDLLQTNIKLNFEITDLENRTRNEECSKNSFDGAAEEEVLRLVEKISRLQLENANLRDKNDELVSEVEALNAELCREKTRSKKSSTATSSALHEQDTMSTMATGCRGDTSAHCLALNSELLDSATTTIGTNTDLTLKAGEEMDVLKQKVDQLEEELKTLKAVDACGSEERCKELEGSLEQMQRAYEDCEDYWQNKLSEERQMFDKERRIYEDEQQESDKKFTELMEKVREYEEQFSKDGRLTPIEEKDTLEQQYADLEAEAEEVRENAKLIFEEKSKEIELLQQELEDLRMRLGESVEILTGASELNIEVTQKGPEMDSPANSPINYLWHQSTIQSPVKEYQSHENSSSSISPTKQRSCINLSTSETTIFSTTPHETIPSSINILPIQKPAATKPATSESDAGDCDSSSTISRKSSELNSVASTHSVHHSHFTSNNIINHDKHLTNKSRAPSTSPSRSPNGVKEELKRLKFFEISLKEQIKDLSLQRDGLVMELQQLQEARPVLEKAYARTAHPTLIQRVDQLELRNRHLQNVIKQQQQYTESLMQQTWQQHHSELMDLRSRIEAQSMMMSEQSQRLQNADVLVKELYVENSHLTATVQRMEQQRTRANLLHQHQGLSGLPGMMP